MVEVVATIAGVTEDVRARVVRLAGGSFAVEVQRLFDATDAGGESHGQFWGTVDYPPSFFDNESRAGEFAAALLRGEPDAEPSAAADPAS